MTATPTAFSLGKNHKLFVGALATSSTDSTFSKVVNENSITLTWKADNDKVNTKEGGLITVPNGDESYEIKGQADIVFADTALATLLSAANQAWPYQIRDLSVPASPTVFAEGMFIVTDREWKMDDKGVKSVTFTMENAGIITLNLTNGGRAVTSS